MSSYTHLHWYRCTSCKTYATTPVKADWFCHLCPGWGRMRFMWSEPIETDDQRRLAMHGPTYNPGLYVERLKARL